MRLLRHTWLLILALLPQIADAQSCTCPGGTERCLCLFFGTGFTITGLAANIINFLAASIGGISVALFVAGAFMLTISGVKEDYRQKGKDLMEGSLIGLAVVLGAYAIWRMVLYILL